MTIKDKYQSVLDELAQEFAKITDKQGEWTIDYELWVTEFEAWTPNDMLYIVDNYERLINRYADEHTPDCIKHDFLLDDIEAWIDYNVDVATFGIKYINLKSWLAGCPRLSKEEIEHIKQIKRELDDLFDDYKEKFGELDTNPQPEHLRKLKKSIHER